MPGSTTVGEALAIGRFSLQTHSETPGLDSQVLLSHVINRSKEWLLTHPEKELRHTEIDSYKIALQRLIQGEPLPYVLGWWEFFGRRFMLSPAALIPRPETELIIELAATHIRSKPGHLEILDLGTGSGCIAITLLLECSNTMAVASDLSFEALRLARKNANNFHVQHRLSLVQSDLLTAFNRRFDLICANLPYIPTQDVPLLRVGKWEPSCALDGGKVGMEITMDTILQLGGALKAGGRAIFEIGAAQAESMVLFTRKSIQDVKVETHPDLTGIGRVLVVEL